MNIGSEEMSDIIRLGKIYTNVLEVEFGKLGTDELIVTNERIQHIKDRHPEDFDLFDKYGTSAATKPNIIIKDEKNVNTVFMIKQTDSTNLNVVVKVVLENDKSNLKNSVMTFYRIREKNLKKLMKKNKVLYKSE